MAVCFSLGYKKILDNYFEKGYRVKRLSVGHIVYWWDKEAEVNIRVVLPEVELEK